MLLRSSARANAFQRTLTLSNGAVQVPTVGTQERVTGLKVEPSSALNNVTVLHLDSPPVNTLTASFLNEFNEVIAQHAKGGNPSRGLIITSSVPNVFSAGLDLNVLYSQLRRETFFRYWSLFQEMWLLLHNHPKPIVAAINGACPAAGCIMAMACDYRVMARVGAPTPATPSGSAETTAVDGKEKSATTSKTSPPKKYTIGITASRAGFAAPYWVAANLRSLVGGRHAERLTSTGALIEADEALGIGLVDEVVEDSDQALVAAHAEIERQLAADLSTSHRVFIKETIRQPLTSLLATKELRDDDAMRFFAQLEHPNIRERLGFYVNSLKRGKPAAVGGSPAAAASGASGSPASTMASSSRGPPTGTPQKSSADLLSERLKEWSKVAPIEDERIRPATFQPRLRDEPR